MMVAEMPLLPIEGYHLRVGKRSDRRYLIRFMHQAYRERDPQVKRDPFLDTVEQLWSEQTPAWFIEQTIPEVSQGPVGCLWLGNATDQRLGDRYTHVFLLYVEPAHRHQGLGTALMHHAEYWARLQGHHHVGLHVLTDNAPALKLYQALGYAPQATFLQKTLSTAL
jgi:ribosomal protein S18 acetylase RimI-like enzyme